MWIENVDASHELIAKLSISEVKGIWSYIDLAKQFFDQGIKISHELPVPSIKQGLQFYGGVKNVFNAYQDDFDIGRYRDSNFVYGPARPRTYFFGIRLQTL